MPPSSPPTTIIGKPSAWQIWKQRWPLLIWALVGAAAWALNDFTQTDTTVTGILEPTVVYTASVNGGLVLEVLVKPGQPIKAGDTLVKLDSSLIDAEIAATQAILEDERIQRERQFASAIQRVEAELRELRLQQASDGAEAIVYRNELERLRKALGQQLITMDSIAVIQAKAESLEKLASLYPELIQGVEEELEALKALKTETATDATQSSAYRAQKAQMELLEKTKAQYTLKAESDGIVGEVLVRPGSVLISGQPAASIMTNEPIYVMGFLPETDTRQLNPGDRLMVRGPHPKSSAIEATIESISPLALTIPDTTTTLPNRFVRGKPFRLVPDAIPADWTPGQSVTIQEIKESWWPF